MTRRQDLQSPKFPLRSRLNLLTVAGIFLIVYLGVLVVQTIMHNYKLRQQIGKLETEIMAMRSEQEELKYRIQYYKTDAFVEKQARAKLGLKDPGESVIMLPKEQADPESGTEKPQEPTKSNWRQWMEFLFG